MRHDTVVTIFIILAAAAIVVQAFTMLGVYRIVARLENEIRQQLGPLAQSLTGIATDSRQPLANVTANLAEVSRILRMRTATLDGLADELVDKARIQIIRVDQAIADVLEKVEATTGLVQKSIIGPILEMSALVKGIRSGLGFLFSRRQGSAVRETAPDEPMFI